jgi:hypothetical protein
MPINHCLHYLQTLDNKNMNPDYQKATTAKVSSADNKTAALDYDRVGKIVKYYAYEEEIKYEPIWNLLEGSAVQPFGEPQGIGMRSKQRIYNMQSEKEGCHGTTPNAVLP